MMRSIVLSIILSTECLAGTHIQQGDTAGGDLTGTYPSPTVNQFSVSQGTATNMYVPTNVYTPSIQPRPLGNNLTVTTFGGGGSDVTTGNIIIQPGVSNAGHGQTAAITMYGHLAGSVANSSCTLSGANGGSGSAPGGDVNIVGGAASGANVGGNAIMKSGGATTAGGTSGDVIVEIDTATTTGTVKFQFANTNVLTLNKNSLLGLPVGSVGISTGIPQGLLHVQNTTTKTGFIVTAATSTGAGSAALGANSPAVTNTAPFCWVKFQILDNTGASSDVFIPAWK